MIRSLAAPYKSGCQRARVVTENWGKENLFCPNCESDQLACSPANAQAIDYVCPQCSAPFQLKSQASRIGDSIPDAGFYAMMKAIREDRTPNLFVLEYERDTWRVRNLLLVPHFAFTPSAIFRRNRSRIRRVARGGSAATSFSKTFPRRRVFQSLQMQFLSQLIMSEPVTETFFR